MKNVKYVYNEHTLQYEEHKLSRREKFRKSLYFTSAVVLTSVLMFVFAYQYFPTPKEKVMEKEKEQLEFYLAQLTDEYGLLSKKIESLHEKDSEINRMILGAKPIDDGIWNGGIGGHDKLSFSENGFYLASGDEKGEVKLWDLRRLKNFHTLPFKSAEPVAGLEFDASGSYLAVTGPDVSIYATKQWEVVHTWKDLTGPAAAWYFRSTPLWFILMALGTLVYAREMSRLRAAGVDVEARFAALPPE